MPLPLISPFPPPTVAHLHQRPSSYIRIPHRHLVVGVVATTFPFLVDFCEVPPLLSAFAHVPFYTLLLWPLPVRSFALAPQFSISLSTQNRFWTIVCHLLPGQQLHSSHVHTYTHAPGPCLESQLPTAACSCAPWTRNLLVSTIFTNPTLFGPSLHHDTLRTLIDRRC